MSCPPSTARKPHARIASKTMDEALLGDCLLTADERQAALPGVRARLVTGAAG
jgi:hypothetical protein